MLRLSRPRTIIAPLFGNPRLEQASARIFNHDIMGCTADGVDGNHLYCGRALGMTLPGDIIQLHPDLKPQWSFINAHYDRIGMSVTDHVIWNLEQRTLAEHRDRDFSVFHFGAAEQAACPERVRYEVVKYINSKNNFIVSANELGVPVPATRCYGDVSEIDEAEICELDFPCYLKAAVYLSGVDIHRCEDQHELRAAVKCFGPKVPVQVQAEIPTDCFLSLQYEVTDKGLTRLAAAEHVLGGSLYEGHLYPARVDAWDCVEPMARWLYEQGILGVFAFDVAVVHALGGTDYLAIECNPRFNGASYPTAVAERLGIRHWLARVFQTEYRSLADINLNGLEYDRAFGQGIVLINWGTILVGELAILIAGPPEVQEYLSQELYLRL